MEFDTSEIAMYELGWLAIKECVDLTCVKVAA